MNNFVEKRDCTNKVKGFQWFVGVLVVLFMAALSGAWTGISNNTSRIETVKLDVQKLDLVQTKQFAIIITELKVIKERLK